MPNRVRPTQHLSPRPGDVAASLSGRTVARSRCGVAGPRHRGRRPAVRSRSPRPGGRRRRSSRSRRHGRSGRATRSRTRPLSWPHRQAKPMLGPRRHGGAPERSTDGWSAHVPLGDPCARRARDLLVDLHGRHIVDRHHRAHRLRCRSDGGNQQHPASPPPHRVAQPARPPCHHVTIGPGARAGVNGERTIALKTACGRI